MLRAVADLILANQLQVSRFPVAEFRTYSDKLTLILEGKSCLVCEPDCEIQDSVLNAIGDEVYDLAVYLGICFAKRLIAKI